ncbi:MAG: hypothetical protein M1818_007845 [Claussenomyces sp. TS43310]|nr:MAG: hypothetical protein M1818_007845 [Claussenomyces sp. TS43310]
MSQRLQPHFPGFLSQFRPRSRSISSSSYCNEVRHPPEIEVDETGNPIMDTDDSDDDKDSDHSDDDKDANSRQDALPSPGGA